MHDGLGRTLDVDFGIAVPDWNHFNTLKSSRPSDDKSGWKCEEADYPIGAMRSLLAVEGQVMAVTNVEFIAVRGVKKAA